MGREVRRRGRRRAAAAKEKNKNWFPKHAAKLCAIKGISQKGLKNLKLYVKIRIVGNVFGKS